jgi:hypothetical protein
MKHTKTTDSTTFTTKGWKKDHLGKLVKIIDKDTRPAFQKEIDQTLFSNEVKVDDLPQATWFLGGCDCPNDLIRCNISNIIHRLVETIRENQLLENQNKKATFNLNWLAEAKDELDRLMGIVVLYKRYNIECRDFSLGRPRDEKLIAETKTELVASLKRYGLKV